MFLSNIPYFTVQITCIFSALEKNCSYIYFLQRHKNVWKLVIWNTKNFGPLLPPTSTEYRLCKTNCKLWKTEAARSTKMLMTQPTRLWLESSMLWRPQILHLSSTSKRNSFQSMAGYDSLFLSSPWSGTGNGEAIQNTAISRTHIQNMYKA